jgi:hypothetical protein
VVNFIPRGDKLESDPDPLGIPITVGLCGACQALDANPSAEPPVCPTCGESEQYRRVQISEPRGFRTNFWPGRSFDGHFDWTPRASRARMAATPISEWKTVGNARIWTGPQQRVYSIKDNNGKDFEFHKAADGNGWIVPTTLSESDQIALDANTNPVHCALASITTTDVLLVGLDVEPVTRGLNLDPRPIRGRIGSRAAWYSFGFFLRSAAAKLLDVDPNEFRVGLRTLKREEKIEAEIFLSDFLENGAGYSTYLGRPQVFARLLQSMLDDYGLDKHGPQGRVCDSACYDCLKDYANMAYHGLLDWRLAMDMTRLANGQAIELTGWWAGIPDQLTKQFCKDFDDWTETRFGPLLGAVCEDRALIAVHPLWDVQPTSCVVELSAAIAEAESRGFTANGTKQWVTVDWFDLARRPAWVAANIIW